MAATDGDGVGHKIFRPSTVQVTGPEVAAMKASQARFRTDPDAEREQAGRFWQLWTLHPDGIITPRGTTQGRRQR